MKNKKNWEWISLIITYLVFMYASIRVVMLGACLIQHDTLDGISLMGLGILVGGSVGVAARKEFKK